MKANNILDTIGNTPHLKINRLFNSKNEVWVKLERANPGGSIKDRIALSMIEQAEKEGLLKEGSVIVEPTSGNTGIGLAMVAAVKGYGIILVMPESMSIERRKIMSAFGAKFVLTAKEKGMSGAIEKAKEIAETNANAWIPQQFENPANPEIHQKTTGVEIWEDTDGKIDILCAGVGTGGTISGISKYIKSQKPDFKAIALEPSASPFLSKGEKGPHPIQGIGAGFIPENLHTELLDGVIQVEQQEAFEYARRCAREEGILVGISSGASLAAVARKLGELPPGSRVLTFCYDTGERYLSSPLFEGIETDMDEEERALSRLTRAHQRVTEDRRGTCIAGAQCSWSLHRRSCTRRGKDRSRTAER